MLAASAAAQSRTGGDWRSVVAPSAPQAGPTLEDLERLLRDESQRLVRVEAEDGRTLPDADPAPLVEALGAELTCGTPSARLAGRLLREGPSSDERRVELEQLLARPALAAGSRRDRGGLALEWDRSVTSRHAAGARDADRNGTPDLVEAAEADLRHALEHVRERLEWAGPSPGRPLSVLLAASAWPDGRLVSTDGEAHVLLPRELGGEDRLRVAAHQLAHAALAELAPDAPLGWEEAAATFVAASVVAEATGRELDPRLLMPRARDDGRRHPRRALATPELDALAGDAAFFAFLDGPQGLREGWLPELWRELGERLAEAGDDGPARGPGAVALGLEALDGLLVRDGSDLASAVARYFEEMLTSELLAGPPVSVDERLPSLPATTARSGDELPPFGQLRFEVPVPRDGGLRVEFDSEARAEAEVFALLADGRLDRFPLGGSAWGDRSLRLAGGRLAAIVVLVQAPHAGLDPAAWSSAEVLSASGEFRLHVEEDRTYPFVLAEVSSEARVGQVRVDWSTSSEDDLVAWHVERARRLSGPWRRLTGVPVPPSARPGLSWSYSVVDPEVRASTRYHYRLVAVTAAGLSERSSTVSVLTLPDGPALEPESRR